MILADFSALKLAIENHVLKWNVLVCFWVFFLPMGAEGKRRPKTRRVVATLLSKPNVRATPAAVWATALSLSVEMPTTGTGPSEFWDVDDGTTLTGLFTLVR